VGGIKITSKKVSFKIVPSLKSNSKMRILSI